MLLYTVFRYCALLFLVKMCTCETTDDSDGDASVNDLQENEPLKKIRGEVKGSEVDSDDGNGDKYADDKDIDDKNDDDKDYNDKDDDGKDANGKDNENKDVDNNDDDDKDDNAPSKEDKEGSDQKFAYKTDQSDVTFDLTKGSLSKLVQIGKMSAISGYNFSRAEMVEFKIWPQGAIPFYIDEFSYDKIFRDKIREYLDVASSLSGLRFLEIARPPKDDSGRWVFFINRRGQLNCTDYSSSSFTYTGVQKVVIGYDCLSSGREMAALVLALAGIPPQHNSPDRDTFIQVNMKSIQPDKTKLFTPVLPHQWLFYEIEYDFKSAGHYPSHKYTIDGFATIVAKKNNNEPIGEAEGFSYADIQKMRMLYNLITLQSVKHLKLPECKTLYRPGNNFKNNTSKPRTFNARRKPQKYVAAAKSAGIEIFDGTLIDKNAKENVKRGDNFDLEKSEKGQVQKLKTKQKPKRNDPLKWQDINTD